MTWNTRIWPLWLWGTCEVHNVEGSKHGYMPLIYDWHQIDSTPQLPVLNNPSRRTWKGNESTYKQLVVLNQTLLFFQRCSLLVVVDPRESAHGSKATSPLSESSSLVRPNPHPRFAVWVFGWPVAILEECKSSSLVVNIMINWKGIWWSCEWLLMTKRHRAKE